MEKRFKKGILIILAFMTVIGFAYGGGKKESSGSKDVQSQSDSTKTIETGKKIKIGFTILCTDGFYIKKYIERYEELIKQNGYESVLLDCQFDPAKQVSQLENLIAQEVDVIFLMPSDPLALIPGIKKANEANIPVFAVHSKIDSSGNKYIVGFAGCDNVKLGEGAGELLNEAIGGKGTIVILGGSPGTMTANDLTAGFMSKLSPGVKVLATVDHGWDKSKALTLMEDLLTKYDKIDGVWSMDDNTALGAIEAIKSINRTGIKVVGINGQKEAFDAITKGDLYGTVMQDPVANVDVAFKILGLYLAGKEVTENTYSASPLITKKNVDTMQPAF